MDLTSGYPFWPIRDGLPAAYPMLDVDIRCDAVVLGAGITGAMIAHELVDAGLDTVVVDRREVAWGSTAASTGLLQYEIDVPLTDLMAMRGRECAARGGGGSPGTVPAGVSPAPSPSPGPQSTFTACHSWLSTFVSVVCTS